MQIKIAYTSSHHHTEEVVEKVRSLLEKQHDATVSVSTLNDLDIESLNTNRAKVLFIIPSYKEVPKNGKQFFETLRDVSSTGSLPRVVHSIIGIGNSDYMGEHGENYQQLARELEFLLNRAGSPTASPKAELDTKEEDQLAGHLQVFVQTFVSEVKKLQ
ncbi:hypothetical protein GEMRC1_011849 [Eukaryota sp. GEM-RC1]